MIEVLGYTFAAILGLVFLAVFLLLSGLVIRAAVQTVRIYRISKEISTDSEQGFLQTIVQTFAVFRREVFASYDYIEMMPDLKSTASVRVPYSILRPVDRTIGG